MDEFADNKEISEQIDIEAATIESLARLLKIECGENARYNAIIQSVHRLQDIADFLRKKDNWMLKLTGNVGKSVIVDAIKKYNDARIYSYDKELILAMESYHVNSDECSVKEFCEYILEDINSLSSEQLPVNMVVIYTNLTDKHDITMVEDYANTLEFKRKVGTVVVTSKIWDLSDNMTVNELIDKLSEIEDKSQRVVIECIGNHKVYDASEIVGVYAPKDDNCKEYGAAILISNV